MCGRAKYFRLLAQMALSSGEMALSVYISRQLHAARMFRNGSADFSLER